MTIAVSGLDSLTLTVTHEIHVRASLTATFDALIEQMGPGNETPEGMPLPMTIEPRPGGRWFRDLGKDDGHFWGTVQAIKRPTLLEITGPLMMSFAVSSNVQYRLKAVEGGTVIAFSHTALGLFPDGYREAMSQGWVSLADRLKQRAGQA